jgi:hypothetical protein
MTSRTGYDSLEKVDVIEYRLSLHTSEVSFWRIPEMLPAAFLAYGVHRPPYRDTIGKQV